MEELISGFAKVGETLAKSSFDTQMYVFCTEKVFATILPRNKIMFIRYQVDTMCCFEKELITGFAKVCESLAKKSSFDTQMHVFALRNHFCNYFA